MQPSFFLIVKNIVWCFVITYPIVCIRFSWQLVQNLMQRLYIVMPYYIFFMAYVVLHLVFLQVEKEKSLQIFILQFVETFRDWGPRPIKQLDDQELESDKTVVGCSCGHPSEVILILIQEISLITSTIVESKLLIVWWLYIVSYASNLLCEFKSIILMFVNSTVPVVIVS